MISEIWPQIAKICIQKCKGKNQKPLTSPHPPTSPKDSRKECIHLLYHDNYILFFKN